MFVSYFPQTIASRAVSGLDSGAPCVIWTGGPVPPMRLSRYAYIIFRLHTKGAGVFCVLPVDFAPRSFSAAMHVILRVDGKQPAHNASFGRGALEV